MTAVTDVQNVLGQHVFVTEIRTSSMGTLITIPEQSNPFNCRMAFTEIGNREEFLSFARCSDLTLEDLASLIEYPGKILSGDTGNWFTSGRSAGRMIKMKGFHCPGCT
jgi:hypothetical protein